MSTIESSGIGERTFATLLPDDNPAELAGGLPLAETADQLAQPQKYQSPYAAAPGSGGSESAC